MKLAVAEAIAKCVANDEMNDDYIIPDIFDKRVVSVVSSAVKRNI